MNSKLDYQLNNNQSTREKSKKERRLESLNDKGVIVEKNKFTKRTPEEKIASNMNKKQKYTENINKNSDKKIENEIKIELKEKRKKTPEEKEAKRLKRELKQLRKSNKESNSTKSKPTSIVAIDELNAPLIKKTKNKIDQKILESDSEIDNQSEIQTLSTSPSKNQLIHQPASSIQLIKPTQSKKRISVSLQAQNEFIVGLNSVKYAPLTIQETESSYYVEDKARLAYLSTCYAIDKNTTKGTFTEREKEAIQQAIDYYCQKEGIDQCNWIYLVLRALPDNPFKVTEHVNFLTEVSLYSKLNRTKEQIYLFLRRNVIKRGRLEDAWRPEEDLELLRLVIIYGENWTKIENLMSRVCSRERYRILVRLRDGYNKGKWTLEEDCLLRDACRAHRNHISKADLNLAGRIQDDDVADLDHNDNGSSDKNCRKMAKLKNWVDIGAIVKTRNWRQCLIRWYNHSMFLKEGIIPKYTRKELLEILKLMRDCKPFDESEIRWKELSAASQSESWSHTGRSIGMLQYKWFRLRSFVPDRESKTLLECINFCIDNYEQLVSPAQSKEFIDSESDIDDDVDSQADRINDEDLEIIF